MKTLTRAALPLLLALSLSGAAAFAQAPKDAERRGPSPEMMGRFQDGKFAMAKTTLKLTDEQLKLWAPVEGMIRKMQDERMKMWTERREQKRGEGAGEGGRRADATPLPERLEKRSDEMIRRAEQTKALAGVLKPLFSSFTEEQKQVAGPVFAQLIGGGKGHGMHGGRGGMHRGHHGHGGPMMHRGRHGGGQPGMRDGYEMRDEPGQDERPGEQKG